MRLWTEWKSHVLCGEAEWGAAGALDAVGAGSSRARHSCSASGVSAHSAVAQRQMKDGVGVRSAKSGGNVKSRFYVEQRRLQRAALTPNTSEAGVGKSEMPQWVQISR